MKAIEAAIGSPLERHAAPTPDAADTPRRGRSRRRDDGDAVHLGRPQGQDASRRHPGRAHGRGGRIQGSDVGKIEIHDRFSYVAIAKGSADRAIQRLGAGRIKGKRFKVGLAR